MPGSLPRYEVKVEIGDYVAGKFETLAVVLVAVVLFDIISYI